MPEPTATRERVHDFAEALQVMLDQLRQGDVDGADEAFTGITLGELHRTRNRGFFTARSADGLVEFEITVTGSEIARNFPDAEPKAWKV